LPIITVGEPGVQGAAVTGIQGWGVNTPAAADVAAATWGLIGVVHIPKGEIFFIGMLSKMVAAAILDAFTLFSGVTFNVLGIIPKLQVNAAPIVTS
jgi:hypothetical protein